VISPTNNFIFNFSEIFVFFFKKKTFVFGTLQQSCVLSMSFFEMLLYVGHPLFVPKAVKALKGKKAAAAAAAAAAAETAAAIDAATAAVAAHEQALASVALSRRGFSCGPDFEMSSMLCIRC
jgi:hypothetical protein